MQARIYSAQRYSFRVEQLWVDPTSVQNPAQRKGSHLNTRFVRVASELAPMQSPAPAGHAIVPEGWVRQMGDEGEQDMGLVDARTTPPTPAATMSQFTVPYYTGGWPADPLIGQPGHTKPTQ